jgi:hypothetical protein
LLLLLLLFLKQLDLVLGSGRVAAQVHVSEAGRAGAHGLAALDALDAALVAAKQDVERVHAYIEVGAAIEAVAATHFQFGEVAVELEAGDEYLPAIEQKLGANGLEK